MLKIGLTGGMGSGKSAASACFKHLGIAVIDADELSREAVLPGSPALQKIIDHFGPGMLNSQGQLDRARLREHIFNTPEERKVLEQILHPDIRRRMLDRINQLQQAAYVVCEIPLLVETGQQSSMDRVLVIDVDKDTQRRRIRQRDQFDDETIERILAAQTSRENRRMLADDIIDNSGTLDELRQAVEKLHHRYLDRAKRNAAATETGP